MGNKPGIHPGFFLYFAMAVLLLPLPWLMAMAFSALWHELCHWLAIRLCGGHAGRLSLSAFAARMPLPPMDRWQEFFCALAGPAGTLLLLPLLPWFPRTVLCSLAQSCYNLLPVYPLDGGRALACLLSMLFSPRLAGRLMRIVSLAVIAGTLFFSVYGLFFLKLGLLPLFLSAMLLLQIKSAKIPCKAADLRVQ